MASAVATSSRVKEEPSSRKAAADKIWSFNDPEVQGLSALRSQAIRLPDIAWRDSMKYRLITPSGRRALGLKGIPESDHEKRIAKEPAEAALYSVPGAQHASLFLSYLQEHDTSTAELSLYNNVDYEPCPSWDFAYIDEAILSPKVASIDRDRNKPSSTWGKLSTHEVLAYTESPTELQGTRRGCLCGSGDGDDAFGDCNPDTCECRHLQSIIDTGWREGSELEGFAYNPDGTLKDSVLSWSGLSVFECTDACGCSDDCPNRVVQRGRQVPLELFKTAKCGWGIRSKRELKAGTFITTYSGELLTNNEAEARGLEYDRTVGTTYLMDLEPYHAEKVCNVLAQRAFPNDPANTEEEKARVHKKWEATSASDPYYLTLDASHFGNVSRYFNHSCDPNMRIQYVYTSSILDQARPTMAFFTTRRVKAFEELRFSYRAAPEEGEAQEMLQQMSDQKTSVIKVEKAAGNKKGRIPKAGSSGDPATGDQTLFAKICHCGAACCSGAMFDSVKNVAAEEDSDDSEYPSASESNSGDNRRAAPSPSTEARVKDRDSRSQSRQSTTPHYVLGSTRGMDWYVDMSSPSKRQRF
ncbi:unnamed protein product [Parajaminaea phylloscopi]